MIELSRCLDLGFFPSFALVLQVKRRREARVLVHEIVDSGPPVDQRRQRGTRACLKKIKNRVISKMGKEITSRKQEEHGHGHGMVKVKVTVEE